MKNYLYILISFVLSIANSLAQDTFSIVAVDTVTGEFGSAGASCIDNSNIAGGVVIISDPHPGVGVIHSQAYWISTNANNASNRMDLGDSPQEIIDWLVANDVQSNPGKRQYGIVDLDGNGSPRTAAYTGATSDDYKSHILGSYYSIQGNTLLGQGILDSMESRFLNEPGDLGAKLMAALQGANVPGADTRCLLEGVSSLSAFVRVIRPCDTLGPYYMDLKVVETAFGVEPIDSLQVLFDAFIPDPAPVSFFTYTDSLNYVYFTDASTGALSLWWDFGDGGGSSTPNPLRVYSTSGTYKVCLTISDDCITTKYCENITVTVPVSINELGRPEPLRIYPNPGTGVFTVDIDKTMVGGVLTVVNVEGKELKRMPVLNDGTFELDLMDFPKGLYTVQVLTDDGTFVTPLVFE